MEISWGLADLKPGASSTLIGQWHFKKFKHFAVDAKLSVRRMD